jgi:membrane protease YdiL (CAAX protease family)
MTQVRPAEPTAETTRLPAWFTRRPMAAVLGLTAADLALSALSGLAAKALLPGVRADFVALCVMTAALVAALTAWRAWRFAGFNRPAAWRNLGLLLVPALVTVALPVLGGLHAQDAGAVGFLVLGYALTGMYEEGFSRGLVLGLLRGAGPARAAAISGLLFALLHASNVVHRPVGIVLAQMVGAACDGFAFGVLRLRTGSVWPVAALHALHDLLLHVSNFPLIPLNVAQDVLLLAYGLWLLRGARRAARPVAAAA